MSDSAFDGPKFAEKLFKLNSSQQTIESLSRLCISHRKKAKQLVETWDKSFKSAQREQHVSFLFLANDILQNSRRKGSEFVNEFWKVLPSALKHVNEHGDENGKKAASRLVEIWHERRVFGSRGQNLKDEMLGKSPLPEQASNGRSSNPIKIVKRDANSLRLKLAVGGMPEKIITAFKLAHDENATEDRALNNCEGAVRRFGDFEREIETQGNLMGSARLDEIQEQENVLKQCVDHLETAEATRVSLVSQLKVALQDQESKLEVIHTQLQVARQQFEHAVNLRQKLAAGQHSISNQSSEVMKVVNHFQSNQVASLPPSAQTLSSSATTSVTEEENKKAAAAAIAAKLAASTSSAQMLTSVLSSLVAEEAAAALTAGSFKPVGFSPEKRPKRENQTLVSDLSNPEAVSTGYFTQFAPPPPPPPLPPLSTFAASMMGGMPYAYGGSSLPPPPPPPLPSHIAAMGSTRPGQPQTASGGYYRSPGVGFYGQTQSHQSRPPPPCRASEFWDA